MRTSASGSFLRARRGYILDPAAVKGPDYPSARRVFKNSEIARFGEYRTARLILQARDAFQRKELLR